MATVANGRSRTQARSAPKPDPIASIFARLAAPFDPSEVKTRPGRNGTPLRYLEAPTVRRRLNDVLGPAGWECDVTAYDAGTKCVLVIHLPDGTSLKRSALGGYAAMPGGTDEDRFKSGDTDAFKRAARLFGVGEYLCVDDAPASHAAPERSPDDLPRSGRDLYHWAIERDLLRTISEIGSAHGFPARVTQWSHEHVATALRELG